MQKFYCDLCKEEIIDQKFRFEGILVEITHSLNPQKGIQSQAEKKIIHLCKKCYKEKIDL